MTKRNLIILIVIMGVILAVFFGYVFLSGRTATPTDTTTGGGNFFSQLFPIFKTPTAEQPAPTDISGNPSPVPVTETPKPKLVKVSSMPVAGYVVFQKEVFKDIPPVIPEPTVTTEDVVTSKTIAKKTVIPKPVPPPTEFITTLRYVSRINGNIFQTGAGDLDERKLTTTSVPKVYEAYFGNNGNSVVMRFLKNDDATIETFAGALPKEILGGDTTADTEVKGSFFPENITDMSVSLDSSQIFYLFNIGNGSVGITSDMSGVKKTQVFDSPFTEWLSGWSNAKMITLTTKPSSNVPGYMYAVDPAKKDFNKILSGINGLTTLASPNGKLVLYSNNNLSFRIFNVDTGNSTPLNIKTMPEKCVWTKASDALYCAVPKFLPSADYPDSWYQGEISFSDEIWKINVSSGTASNLADPVLIIGDDVDGIKLALDDSQQYLFFVNKKDSYLWELKLQ